MSPELRHEIEKQGRKSFKIYRGVEQLVARWAHNPKVTGSSPVPATNSRRLVGRLFYLCCMLFHVYVLYAEKHNKIYVGYTSDLQGRLKAHNEFAKNSFTSKFRPWVLIYKEDFTSKLSAMKREKQLKSAKGRAFIRKNLIPPK